jgi:hypothetical protein
VQQRCDFLKGSVDLLFRRGGFDYGFGVFEISIDGFDRFRNSVLLSHQYNPSHGMMIDIPFGSSLQQLSLLQSVSDLWSL